MTQPDPAEQLRKKIIQQSELLVKELRQIKGSISYRVTEQLNQTPLVRGLRRMRQGAKPQAPEEMNGHIVNEQASVPHVQSATLDLPTARTPPAELLKDHLCIEPLGLRGEGSEGNEVWILSIDGPQRKIVDLRSVEKAGAWDTKGNQATPSGVALVSTGNSYILRELSETHRIVFLSHPWSGVVKVHGAGCDLTIDLYDPKGGTVTVNPLTGMIERKTAHGVATDLESWKSAAVMPLGTPEFSESELLFIAAVRKNPGPVAVMHPEWRGICAASQQLFEHTYGLDDYVTPVSASHIAQLFAAAGCTCIVIQGFPHTYVHLVRAMRAICPQVPVHVVWHGTFLQVREDYVWVGFRMVEELSKSGLVSKWGFTKKGMAEIMAGRGHRTAFLMNMVKHYASGPSKPLPGGPHLGIWALQDMWHKPPYEMLAGLSMIKDAHIHASGASDRSQEFAASMALKADMQPLPIDRHEMPRVLSQMHLNLYVTFNECAPMLPLESLSAGAPCLLGPTAHYFEDYPFLAEHLVVPSSDNAYSIGQYAKRALGARDEIIAAYIKFAPEYNELAARHLMNFLETPAVPEPK